VFPLTLCGECLAEPHYTPRYPNQSGAHAEMGGETPQNTRQMPDRSGVVQAKVLEW